MSSSRPTAIAPFELQQLLRTAAAPRILDVRSPGEFDGAHIPGSYNVPLDVLREHRDELLHHLDEDVVLVCRSGMRATQAEQALAEAGLPNVRVLTGGMNAWTTAGNPVNTGRARWDLERQVRLVAGAIVLSSVVASVALPRLKWLAGAVGAGLTGAALTNTCAMGAALSKLPYNRGASCDVQTVVAQLSDQRRAA